MTTSTEHARLLRLATRASVAVACILIVAKAIAWWLSGSVSMLAGLTDSALDGVSSLLNLLAVHYALRPADDDHRYGHGKAESLAGMAQALFIGGSAVLIALQAIERLKHPEPIGAAWLSIGVIVFFPRPDRGPADVAASGNQGNRFQRRERRLLALPLRSAAQRQHFWWRWCWPVSAGIKSTLGSDWGLPPTSSGAPFISPGKVFAVLMDEELPPDVSQHMLELACSVPGVFRRP